VWGWCAIEAMGNDGCREVTLYFVFELPSKHVAMSRTMLLEITLTRYRRETDIPSARCPCIARPERGPGSRARIVQTLWRWMMSRWEKAEKEAGQTRAISLRRECGQWNAVETKWRKKEARKIWQNRLLWEREESQRAR
jgi:hypothetical protein